MDSAAGAFVTEIGAAYQALDVVMFPYYPLVVWVFWKVLRGWFDIQGR